MKYNWKPKTMSVGNEEIDHQHQEMFQAANNIAEALREGRGEGEIKKIFEFLKTYAENHFAQEEAIMEKWNYPDIEKHRELHKQWIKNLHKLEEKLNTDGPTLSLSLDIHENITSWLSGHIVKEDMNFKMYLDKHVENSPKGEDGHA